MDKGVIGPSVDDFYYLSRAQPTSAQLASFYPACALPESARALPFRRPA